MLEKYLSEEMNMTDFLKRSAMTNPGKAACISNGEQFTYSYIYDQGLKLANVLKRTGLREGDRVLVHLENSPELVISIYGIMFSGGVFSVVNPQTKAEKLEFIVNDCRAAAIICESRSAKSIAIRMKDNRHLRTLMVNGEFPSDLSIRHGDVLPFAGSISRSEQISMPSQSLLSSLAALIYTSGSTGEPKGVMMSHQSMVFITKCLDKYLGLGSEDRIMNFLPMSFDYGLYQLFMSVSMGATLVIEKSFAFPYSIVEKIRTENITILPGVPTAFKTLLAMSARKELVFENVKKVTNTAAALTADIVPKVMEMFPNAEIFKMYGLTECKRISYLRPDMLTKHPASVGKAIPGTEIYLLDSDGNPVGPETPGILHVRGPHVMMGYWERPEQTSKMLREDLFPGEKVLCTHDWFTMNEEGYYFFKGRSDDIIKTRGEKVSPIEVETCLDSIPGIKDSAVIGVSDELWGEAIEAYVVLDGTRDLGENDIKMACNAKLENYMVPKKVFCVDELPVTSTGKVRKADLKEREVNKGAS